jgi:hypothetical protein
MRERQWPVEPLCPDDAIDRREVNPSGRPRGGYLYFPSTECSFESK